jgi:hypothetical protein
MPLTLTNMFSSVLATMENSTVETRHAKVREILNFSFVSGRRQYFYLSPIITRVLSIVRRA